MTDVIILHGVWHQPAQSGVPVRAVGKVTRKEIQERTVRQLNRIDHGPAGLGDTAGVVVQSTPGVPTEEFLTAFTSAVAAHRHHDRAVDAIAA